MNKKVSIILFIVIGVIIAMVFGVQEKEVNAPVVDNIQPTETATTTPEIQTTTQATTTSALINLDWKTYKSDFYGFTLEYPDIEGYRICLDDFCNHPPEDYTVIQYVSITTYGDLYDPNQRLTITPRKNLLGKTAIEFGKEMERQNIQDGNVVSEGKEVVFAGQRAYSLVVVGGFMDNGVSYYLLSDYKGERVPSIQYGQVSAGVVYGSSHRVVYFDKDELFYRVVYPLNDSISERIISSFSFE